MSSADARALWAIRALDAWAETAGDWARGWESCRRPGAFWVTLSDGGKQSFHGPTPDAARHAAALAVYTSLPADVRAELGECP